MPHTKFTPEVGQVLINAARLGHYRRHAAALVGVHERTLRNWINWGLDGDEVYRDWAVEYSQIETERNSKLLHRIVELGQRDWKALAWTLERVDPLTFHLPTKLEHSGADGEPMRAALTPADAAAVMREKFGNVTPQAQPDSPDDDPGS